MHLLERAAKIYSQEGPVTLGRKSARFVQRALKARIRDPIAFQLWKYGLIDFDHLYGREYYEEMLAGNRLDDAIEFSQVVADLYDPDSVIDFGAGAGRFLIPFHEAGIGIRGLERNRKAIETSPLPEEVFDIHDLSDPFESDRQYDVALCMEVLEHLPESALGTTIDSIASSCDVAIVTAATPGQGGVHHVNERELDEWIQLFEARGMDYRQMEVDRLTDRISPNSERWLVANLMVFVNPDDHD